MKEKINLKIILLVFVILVLIIPLDVINNEESINFLAYEEYADHRKINGLAYGNTLSYDEEIAIMAFLKQNANSDEKIFVFMSEPQVYYLSGLDPVIPETFWGERDFLGLTSEELHERILHPLEINNISFVFLVNNSHLQDVYHSENSLLLRNYLDIHYKHVKDIGKVRVYIREEIGYLANMVA